MSASLWPPGLQPTRLLCPPWDSPAEHPGVGCHPPQGCNCRAACKLRVMCSSLQWWTAPTQAWWKTLFVTSTRASLRVLSMEWLLYISARGASTCWDLLPSPAWRTACGIALCPSVWVSGVVWPWKNTANTTYVGFFSYYSKRYWFFILSTWPHHKSY